VYYTDSLFANLIFFAVSVVGVRLLLPAVSKLRLRWEALIVLAWTLAVGLIWITSSQVKASADSAFVTDSALKFAQGDFSDMSGDYLREYPYQLGYIQLCEIVLRAVIALKGVPDTLIVLQAVNVVFLAGAYVGLVLLTGVLFPDPRVRHLTFLMLIFAAQPILSCVFTYGIIPGICFAVWAILLQALWFKKNKLVYGLLSAVCIGLAMLVKNNNLIVFVAMVIVAAIRYFKRGRFVKDVAVVLASAICAFGFSPAVRMLYERRSGVTLEPGMPYVSWIAMGLSESIRAPGWFSFETSNYKFRELGSDPEALSELSKNIISERLTYFKEHPQYTRDFFYRKYVSQFNETTYQSLWNNTVRGTYKEKGRLASWVCGEGNAATRRYMDVFAQAVFVGLIVALFLMLRRKDYTALILPLTVLGGMLFHLIAEGKSQYILPYFVLMLPAAAMGLVFCGDALGRLENRIFPPKEKPQPEEQTA
jgi:hypothetical protein